MAFETAWRILGQAQDAEDAVQEALLTAVRLCEDQGVGNWGGLLRRIVARRALDRLRTRRPAAPLVGEEQAPAAEQPDRLAMDRELARQLRAAVARLPERQGEVFSLRFFGELSNGEIAATLEISLDAVGVALHKARQQLKQSLKDYDRERTV